MQTFDIPLHDIKPIVQIEEYSFYYLLGSIGLGILVLVLVVYFIYYLYKKTKATTTRKVYKEHLEVLDFNDTKNTAYALSTYGNIFKDDSVTHQEVFEDLSKKLSDYKYRKNVDGFDTQTLELIQKYKVMLNA